MKSIPLILPLMALPISGQAEKRGNVEMPQCPNVVFIYADDQDCVARVMQRNQLNEHEAAKRIKHVDRMRKKYFACYADSEWGQPESYDLMLSSSKFGIDGCVELILGSLAQMKGEASVE